MYTFTKDIETGNALIDSQHKQWIDALNSLLSACSMGKGRESILPTLKFLDEYTAKHFADEEALQVKSKYPGYAQHKQMHDAFKKVLRDIIVEYKKDGPSIAVVAKINQNLGSWFINHIKREDVKVVAHLKSSGM